MKLVRKVLIAAALGGTAGLAAAGPYTGLVIFGDSLSDLGTYAPATSLAGNGTAPFFGGRFTTNAYDHVIEGESYRSRLKPGQKAGQRTEKKGK